MISLGVPLVVVAQLPCADALAPRVAESAWHLLAATHWLGPLTAMGIVAILWQGWESWRVQQSARTAPYAVSGVFACWTVLWGAAALSTIVRALWIVEPCPDRFWVAYLVVAYSVPWTWGAVPLLVVGALQSAHRAHRTRRPRRPSVGDRFNSVRGAPPAP